MKIIMDTRRWGELRQTDVALYAIATEALGLIEYAGAQVVTITSIYRTPAEDAALGGTGIHATRPHRSLDIAVEGWGWDRYPPIAVSLKAGWVYDPARPQGPQVALGQPHASATAPHLHLQTSASTARRGDGARETA